MAPDRYAHARGLYRRAILIAASTWCATWHGIDALNLLGICQGGVFSLCYTALHPKKVRNLATMVTPVDFHTPENMLSHWAPQRGHRPVRRYGSATSPADLMNFALSHIEAGAPQPKRNTSASSTSSTTRRKRRTSCAWKSGFSIHRTRRARLLREFARDFFQKNQLIKGKAHIGGRTIDLKKITQPVPTSTPSRITSCHRPLPSRWMGGSSSKDYTALAFKGGHIGIYVSGRAQKQVPPAIHAWLADR